jgi:hypothetical protein
MIHASLLLSQCLLAHVISCDLVYKCRPAGLLVPPLQIYGGASPPPYWLLGKGCLGVGIGWVGRVGNVGAEIVCEW